MTETAFAPAKAEVDRLRRELGQPPIPNLQKILEEQNN